MCIRLQWALVSGTLCAVTLWSCGVGTWSHHVVASRGSKTGYR